MDEALFIALSTEHLPSFYRAAYSIVRSRQDAEDAVQQALLKAWQARTRAHTGSERAWMMRIVIRECYTILRRRKREIPTEELPPIASGPEAPASDVYAAINTLPESLRTPFLLKYMEGLSEKEVAEAVGLSHASVKNRLFRARKVLQMQLNKEVDA